MWRDIFITVTQLIVAPLHAWKDIKKESLPNRAFVVRFLHPLFGVIALTSFVGGLWFAHDGGLQSALRSLIVNVVAVYGGYLIASYTLNEIAPRFGLAKNLSLFQQFTAYSSVVIYVLYIITAFLSELFIIWILALYTVYLVNSGAAYFLKVPKSKLTDFTVAASAIIILAPTLILAIFTYLIM